MNVFIHLHVSKIPVVECCHTAEAGKLFWLENKSLASADMKSLASVDVKSLASADMKCHLICAEYSMSASAPWMMSLQPWR